jgi:hypothetical protein
MGTRTDSGIKIQRRALGKIVDNSVLIPSDERYNRRSLRATTQPIMELFSNSLWGFTKLFSRDKRYRSFSWEVDPAQVVNFRNFCKSFNEKMKHSLGDDDEKYFWLRDRNASGYMRDFLGANYGDIHSYRYFRIGYLPPSDDSSGAAYIELQRFFEGKKDRKNLDITLRMFDDDGGMDGTGNKKARMMLSIDERHGHYTYKEEDFTIFQEFLRRTLELPEEEILRPEKS